MSDLFDELTRPEPRKINNWYTRLPRDAQATLTKIRRKFAAEGQSVSYPVLRERLATRFEGIPIDSKTICSFMRGVSESYPDVEAEDEPKQTKRNRR
jgi:hypothetical protein